MHLCGEMFFNSICNADDYISKEFLNDFKTKIENIMLNKQKSGMVLEQLRKLGNSNNFYNMKPDDKPEIPTPQEETLYRARTPGHLINIDDKNTYYLLYQSIRVAALLHDVGHPPHSHTTERALKKLRNDRDDIEKSTPRQHIFHNIMELYDSNSHLHELVGHRIVDFIFEDKEVLPDITEEEQWKAFPNRDQQIFDVLTWKLVINILTAKDNENENYFTCLHSIIDGPLDADRLDYSTRDAINSGIDVGKIEYDRLLGGMRLFKRNDTPLTKEPPIPKYIFCPSVKVLNTVEGIYSRRWEIYKDIVYHHRVAKTDELLCLVIQDLANIYLNDLNDEKASSNSGGNCLPNDISGLWRALPGINTGPVDVRKALAQWDDSWLLTILKGYYFNQGKADRELPELLNIRLSELLTSKKQYISLIKRAEDFSIIEESMNQQLCKYTKNIKGLIDKLRTICGGSNSKKSSKTAVPIDPMLSNIEYLIKKIKESPENPDKKKSNVGSQGALLSFISDELYTSLVPKKRNLRFDNLLREIVETYFDSIKGEYGIQDVLIIFKRSTLSPGTDGLCVYQEAKKVGTMSPIDIEAVSSIRRVLDIRRNYFPHFYVYVSKNGKNFLRKEKCLQDIGVDIASKIRELIEYSLNNLLESNQKKRKEIGKITPTKPA